MTASTGYRKLTTQYLETVDGHGHASAVRLLSDAEALLRDALDLFSGTHELCDEVESPEWIWRWRVLELLDDAQEVQI